MVAALLIFCALQVQVFDVASVKPNTGPIGGSRTQPLPGGRLRIQNQPLRTLIRTAYQIQDWQLSGGPAWLDSERWDIDAKAEGNPPMLTVVGPMLQALLADRFQLQIHRETKELPIYILLPAKNGVKLTPSAKDSCGAMDPKAARPLPLCGSMGIGGNVLNGAGLRMETLAKTISYLLGRTTIDKTGFDAVFDIHLEYTPDDTNDPSGASLITALQDQAGLKLESAKGPVEILIIDHVEKPAAN